MEVATVPPIGSCRICTLAHADRLAIEGRIVRGDPWQTIDGPGFSYQSVRRHVASDHPAFGLAEIREWLAAHPAPLKGLERAKVRELEAPELSREDIARRILGLERYGMEILRKLDGQGDFRGSVAAVAELRQLTLVLAGLYDHLTPDRPDVVWPDPDRDALRVDVERLIDKKVEEAYLAGMAGLPRPRGLVAG